VPRQLLYVLALGLSLLAGGIVGAFGFLFLASALGFQGNFGIFLAGFGVGGPITMYLCGLLAERQIQPPSP
jgi:hypothetical protein